MLAEHTVLLVVCIAATDLTRGCMETGNSGVVTEYMGPGHPQVGLCEGCGGRCEICIFLASSSPPPQGEFLFCHLYFRLQSSFPESLCLKGSVVLTLSLSKDSLRAVSDFTETWAKVAYNSITGIRRHTECRPVAPAK